MYWAGEGCTGREKGVHSRVQVLVVRALRLSCLDAQGWCIGAQGDVRMDSRKGNEVSDVKCMPV